ncbi:esterase-like activity of phytase family protein [Kitasatospora indigofera]|uniref:esterase-like activity of phytase family protein n=1 Tax=Kitasatospora indigofera TaxID=67307 RepID=UPI00367C6894
MPQPQGPRPHHRRAAAAGSLVLAVLCLGGGPATAAPTAERPARGADGGHRPDVRLLDTITVPVGTVLDGVPFGGVSGIDYDPRSGRYVALSGDRSEPAPARLHVLRLPLDAKGFAVRTPQPAGSTVLSGPDGKPLPRRTVDPEAIRWAPGGKGLLWAGEGDAAAGLPPFVREAAPDGGHRRELPLPAAYRPVLGADGTPVSGVRAHEAFEGLALSLDGSKVVTLTEGSLVQDGPAPTAGAGSRSRLLVQGRADGRPLGEFVYPLGPPTDAGPVPAGTRRGASEILAVNETDYLVVERTAKSGTDFGIRIWWTTTVGATDVNGRAALAGSERVMPKRLLFDFATAGVAPDNVEGLTWGPRLADGSRSLVLVSDDSAGAFGSPGTAFHLLAVRPGLLAVHSPDVDHDGRVDRADLRRLLRSGRAGDLNGDGRTDGRDIRLWGSYGRTFPFPRGD